MSAFAADARQRGFIWKCMGEGKESALSDRVLPVDTAVAQRCAALRVPDPRPERDAIIAATAMVHGMTVVTGNVADFAATGALLLNPWEGVI